MLSPDPFPTFDYLSLTQLGVLCGVEASAVGRWLTQGGLRVNAIPIEKVQDAGMAKLVSPEGGSGSFWAWEKKRTLAVLAELGHTKVQATAQPAPPAVSIPDPVLIGRFAARSNGADGYELVDANGIVAVWVRGEKIAERVAAILSLASKAGKF